MRHSSSLVVLVSCVLVSGAADVRAQRVESAKLHSSGAANGDAFGISVAMSGDSAVVGAYQADLPGSADAGAAYVFVRNGATWAEQARLVAADPGSGSRFGHGVALDGDIAIVGAPNASHAAGANAGAAYVFVRTGPTWTQEAKLIAGDAGANHEFGRSVAVHGDTAIVGARFGTNGVGTITGAAYVFVRTAGVWTQQAKLNASAAASGDQFGFSVALSGETALVGAWTHDVGGVQGAGAAFAFVRSAGTWSEQARLTASDAATDAWLGYDVALAGDTAVLGAWNHSHAGGSSAGAAYVFARSGAVWSEQARLTASDAAALDHFGVKVATDGDTVVVGAWHADAGAFTDAGAAYVFRVAGSVWSEKAKLVARDPRLNACLGSGVAVGLDTALVGAYRAWDASSQVPGALYVFDVGAQDPRDVELVDGDGDGDLDVVTANAGSDDLSLYANEGGGALAGSVVRALTVSDRGPEAVAAGDLDDDGARDDVAVACSGSDTVAVVRDVGSATPVVTSRAAGGRRPVDVAVLDLDGDPRDDVVVGLEGTPFVPGGLSVSLNGAAFAPVTIGGGYPRRVVRLAVGDLDGDGDQDVAALAQGGTDQILLFTSGGDGSLTLVGGLALPTGGLARGLCCGDLDGDGDVDLAVLLPTLFPTAATMLRVYGHTGSGALDPADYTASGDLATGGTFGVDLSFGDVDDDGLQDLLVVHAGSGDVALQNGWSGSGFGSASTPVVGDGPIAAVFGDLDGDGGDDVVVANQASSDVTVLRFAQRALAQAYGTGCAGTGGLVPALGGVGLPLQPSATFGVQLTDARAFAPSLLLFAAQSDALSVSGGCTVLLVLPAASTLRFTNGLGADTFVFGVPATPSLMGLDLYFQHAVFDPAGAYVHALALSNGLRVQVGS